MKIFIDTANLQEIEEALQRGFISGVTTNPSLLAKEQKTAFKDHILGIIALIKRYRTKKIHLSVEVFSRNPDEILRQARDFRQSFGYEDLSIKVQVGWDELGVIRDLAYSGFSVNCTCCMKTEQAILAAAAGAKFVSLFLGRIRDSGGDPFTVVGRTRTLLDKSYPDTQIIVGSIRKETDIIEAGIAGAHIVTVPPKFFEGMASHPKTEEVVTEFLTKFQEWLK